MVKIGREVAINVGRAKENTHHVKLVGKPKTATKPIANVITKRPK